MEERYTILESYIDGEMNAEEKQVFEKRLEQEADLKEELELLREMKSIVKSKRTHAKGENELRQSLQKAGKSHFKKKAKVKKLPRRNIMAVIAAAAAITLLVIWQPWSTSMYGDYVKHPIASFAERSVEGETDLEIGGRHFNNKQYQKAEKVFNSYLKVKPNDIEINHYRAICLLETGNTEEAIAIFNAIAGGNSLFNEEASWYLALSYVKSEQWLKALQSLNRIRPSSRWFASSTKLKEEVLKKID